MIGRLLSAHTLYQWFLTAGSRIFRGRVISKTAFPNLLRVDHKPKHLELCYIPNSILVSTMHIRCLSRNLGVA